MEIHYVDLDYLTYPARKRIADAFLLSNSVMGVTMLKQHAVEIKQDWQQLNHIRRLGPGIHFRNAAITYQSSIRTNYPLFQMKDGTIGSSTLYYRVAKDINNGSLNLFWARDPKHLEAKKNKNGVREFTTDEFRYHVATLKSGETPEVISRAISNHHFQFRKFGIHRMTHYGGDVSDIHNEIDHSAQRKHKRKIYAFTNDACAVSVHQNPPNKIDKKSGGWTLKISNPYELDENKKGFTEVDSMDPDKKFVKAVLSNGKAYGVYKTKAEALANMHMIINQQTQMVWGAQDPSNIKMFPANRLISMATNVTTACYNLMFKEWKKPQNWKGVAFDALKTVAIAVATRALFVVSFPLAMTYTVVGGFTGRKAGVIGGAVWREISYRYIQKAKAFYPTRGDYVAYDRANMDRHVNTKPNTSMNNQLDVLSGSEMDLTYDPEPQKSPIQRRPELMELCAHDGKAFARRVSQIDDQTATEISFNGLARLTRKDPKTGTFITYVKYIDVLDINDKIPLSTKAKKLLEGGKIIKITQSMERFSLIEEEVSFEKMAQTVSRDLFHGDDNVPENVSKAANRHIRWLFNNGACCTEKTAEAEKEVSLPSISSHDKEAAHRSIMPETAEVEKAPEELIEFFEGCTFPIQSYIIRNTLTP